ncbi:MAG: phosphatase PAP2 family protein [Ornithinibacter sp.]
MTDRDEGPAETGDALSATGSLPGRDAPDGSHGAPGRVVPVYGRMAALMAWRDRFSTSWASPGQLGARVAVAVTAVTVAAVPFCLLLLFVQTRWGPLLELDDSARDGLHGYGLAHPLFVTLMRLASDSGSAAAWQVVTVLLVGFLLWQRRVRLALFVVVTIASSSLVNSLVKASANRTRPVVDHPLLHEPGQSFPSGHAQAAAPGYAVLLVLVLPQLNRGAARRCDAVGPDGRGHRLLPRGARGALRVGRGGRVPAGARLGRGHGRYIPGLATRRPSGVGRHPTSRHGVGVL